MKNAPKITFALCAFCLTANLCVPVAFAEPSAPAKKPAKSAVAPSSAGSSSSVAKKPAAAPSLSGGEWSDAEKLMRNLNRKVVKKFETWKPAEIDKFFKEDENRRDVARWELARACIDGENGAEEFKKFAKKSPPRKFLAEFSVDVDWLEGYLYSAPPQNALFAMQLLKAFSDRDPEVKTNPVIKRIATGVAGEFSRRGWFEDEFERDDKEEARKKGPTRIYNRFKFFSESWREKRLNKLFDDLDYWDTRIIVGMTGRTNDIYYGSEESLRWGQDNVKLPEAGYASARDIFQMPYRLWNKIGDSVHTSDYYAPFMEWYGRNQLKRAQEVGCVCGGVSHYGMSAACANGVPAVTMGEPGHCAFAVRVGRKWHDNNSVFWDRSLHWRLWDETPWSFLHLTQEIYDDKNAFPAFRIAALARLAAADKKPGPDVVLSVYECALEKQPRNFPVWREYLEFAKAQKKEKNFWKKAQEKILAAYMPDYPEVAATLLCRHVYPVLFPMLDKDDEKISLYVEYWNKADGAGVGGRWDAESVWDYQAQNVGDGAGASTLASFKKTYNAKEPVAPGNDGAKQRYKEKVGAVLASKKDYAPHFENWKKGGVRK